MAFFQNSKLSDNKRYTVDVKWGFFFYWVFDSIFIFLREVVNIPIQIVILLLLLFRKVIIPQLKLGPPLIEVVW